MINGGTHQIELEFEGEDFKLENWMNRTTHRLGLRTKTKLINYHNHTRLKKFILALVIYLTYNCFIHLEDPPVPPSFTTTPVNKTALEGRRETFYCAADGIPSPTITWSKLGGIIAADRREEPSPGALRIVNLQPEDDGVYICTAQNIRGNRTTQAFLHIQGDFII